MSVLANSSSAACVYNDVESNKKQRNLDQSEKAEQEQSSNKANNRMNIDNVDETNSPKTHNRRTQPRNNLHNNRSTSGSEQRTVSQPTDEKSVICRTSTSTSVDGSTRTENSDTKVLDYQRPEKMAPNQPTEGEEHNHNDSTCNNIITNNNKQQMNSSTTTAAADDLKSARSSDINNSNHNQAENRSNKIDELNGNSSSQKDEQDSGKGSKEVESGISNGAATISNGSSWSNSKYLHKKFKRLASTTNDVDTMTSKAADNAVDSNRILSTYQSLSTTSISISTTTAASSPSSHSTMSSATGPLNCQTSDRLANGYMVSPLSSDTASKSIQSNLAINGEVITAKKPAPVEQQQQHQQQHQPKSSSSIAINASTGTNSNTSNRHVCPYCNMSCAKPSVLQKHIRAHTNERPYPCDICNMAFKTKSNLYKHCRSRSHAALERGLQPPPEGEEQLSDKDGDLELSNSSSELLSRVTSPDENATNLSSPKSTLAGTNESVDEKSMKTVTNLMATSTLEKQTENTDHNLKLASSSSSNNQLNVDYKPYKPKFHNASLYTNAKNPLAMKTSMDSISPVTESDNKVSITNSITTTAVSNSGLLAVSYPNEGATLSRSFNYTAYPVERPSDSVESKQGGNSVYNHSKAEETHNKHALVTSTHNHPLPLPLAVGAANYANYSMKLNNHLNGHHSHHQHLQQHPHNHNHHNVSEHLLAPAVVPAAASASPLSAPVPLPHPLQAKSLPPIPLAPAAYYLPSPTASPSLFHPTAHLPTQHFYDPVAAVVAHQQAMAASLHLMSSSQQQLHHQLNFQQHQQIQQHSNECSVNTVLKSHVKKPVQNSLPFRDTLAADQLYFKATASPTVIATTAATPSSFFHLNSAGPNVAAGPGPGPGLAVTSVHNGKSFCEPTSELRASLGGINISQVEPLSSSSLLQSTTNTLGNGEVHLNKEKLHEHINKIISENEAIVENKELLLQKKYPKTVGRSRGSNNATIAVSSGVNNNTGISNINYTETISNAKPPQIVYEKQHFQQNYNQLQNTSYLNTAALTTSTPSRVIYTEKSAVIGQEEQPLHKNGTSMHIINKLMHLMSPVPLLPTNLTTDTKTNLPLQSQQHIYPQKSLPIGNAVPSSLYMEQQQHYRPVYSATSSTSVITPKYNSTFAKTGTDLTSSNNSANIPLNLSAKASRSVENISSHHTVLPHLLSETAQRKGAPSESKHEGSTVSHTNALSIGNDVLGVIVANSQSAIQNNVPTNSTRQNALNNSIIKNLLLNARGLAVPKGEGEDAVYICPLCSMEFRTAEDLQLHNSTYCQGNSSSAPISPVSSPSYKYFRSNSVSLNMPDLKILSKNPLSLAKLAWSQLKTKPSTLVLSRLSASQAGKTKNSSTTTTSATSTVLISTTTNSNLAISPLALTTSSPKAPESLSSCHSAILAEGPLPSPGPLLGKTQLVDYAFNDLRTKSEDVVITKMHDDRINYTQAIRENVSAVRYDGGSGDRLQSAAVSKKLNHTSGGDFQLLALSNNLHRSRDECFKKFSSSGGCMIPLSECSDIDQSLKVIRTPLLSGGSFQEVTHKKQDKAASPVASNGELLFGSLISAATTTTSSATTQHFQFPPINPITAFNPLTLPLTEKSVPPYIPGIPGPSSLTPQLGYATQNVSPLVTSHQVLTEFMPHAMGSSHVGRLKMPAPEVSPLLLATDLSTAPVSQLGPSQSISYSYGVAQDVPLEVIRPVAPACNQHIGHRVSLPNSSQSLPVNSKMQAPLSEAPPKKSFNFLRMADNISPRKSNNGQINSNDRWREPTKNFSTNFAVSDLVSASSISAAKETRYFNLEQINKDQLVITQPCQNVTVAATATMPFQNVIAPTDLSCNQTATSSKVSTAVVVDGDTSQSNVMEKKAKFLRPTSLSLKPGTFTPKRHHGITPTANTLPLISPETPRPSKACVQLYLNGHSYTYLGLKSSTKAFYCILNSPQPSYVQDMHRLSMYSVWQVCAESNPHPLGLKPKQVLGLYDFRQRTNGYTIAETTKLLYTLVSAQGIISTSSTASHQDDFHHYHRHHQFSKSNNTIKPMNTDECIQEKSANVPPSTSKEVNTDLALVQSRPGSGSNASLNGSSGVVIGGFESHEDYTYIRGRGRGKYVCSECGIRCKKPSMLKKHIRTHTDLRPYACNHCNFSFKTKGNLTKHMQSKTHYKKCLEIGINPGPLPVEGEFQEPDMELEQQSSLGTTDVSLVSSLGNGDTDSEDFSDNETESGGESDPNSTSLLINASSQAMAMTKTSSNDVKSSRLQEQEAARCLISLSMTPPMPACTTPPTVTIDTVVPSMTLSAPVNSITPIVSNFTRRVISYILPKPPFDYNKQEQYYSNPEESKPKQSTLNSPFESAPIDLTKSKVCPISKVDTTTTTSAAFSSHIPGSMNSQSQIHEVIFGNNQKQDESTLLKTLISVNSRVKSRTADVVEGLDKLHEDDLLDIYRKEQILQYHKTKQSHLSRGFTEKHKIFTPTTSVEAVKTMKSPVIENNNVIVEVLNKKTNFAEQSPEGGTSFSNQNGGLAAPTSNDILKDGDKLRTTISKPIEALIDNAEDDPLQEPPTKKIAALQPEEKPIHNSNLPSVVLQPGTTDFTGILTTSSAAIYANHNASTAAAAGTPHPARTVVVGEEGGFTTNNNEIQPVYPRNMAANISTSDGRPVCPQCSKTFQKQSQLVLHMNIHYMERKFKCESCGVSFRTQGHLQKHERSEAHKNKVIMTTTFGVPTTSNPRPFECTDCKIAFRIHGHLAKHLRSKTHVQKLECLQKLPFGTYAEIERAGISLTEIDTSDCDNSLVSLKLLAQRLIEKDPTSKLGSYPPPGIAQDNNSNTGMVSQDSASEDGFSAAASAASAAIASLDNDSAANTPCRANSTSEDEGAVTLSLNNLKRHLPANEVEMEQEQVMVAGNAATTAAAPEKRIRLECNSPVGVLSSPKKNNLPLANN